MSRTYNLTDFLPTTRKEMDLRGWDDLDVILLSGDAYVDHPSFGVAVVGRLLEAEGLRVGIIPQPDWHGDLRDFKRLGRPRLFFGISPGCMDSMVNKYTAARRLRKEDAYSPDGRHDMRPEYPTIVYTECLRKLYPDAPIILGGIEASLRRLSHYDYWQDRLRPSILCDCDADMITYGMGEKNNIEIVNRLLSLIEQYDESLDYDDTGRACISRAAFRKAVTLPEPIRQTVLTFPAPTPATSTPSAPTPTATTPAATTPAATTPAATTFSEIPVSISRNFISGTLPEATPSPAATPSVAPSVEIPISISRNSISGTPPLPGDTPILLHSFEDCLRTPLYQADNFRHIEEESNKLHAQTLIQPTGDRLVVVYPPYPPLTTDELDHSFDLPYTRQPHPKYKGKRIPAFEMIKFSVNMHRGCFGGCAFCTISAHQGKFIVSRSKQSILKEVKEVTQMEGFKGYLSDLGGPSANMYAMCGRNKKACEACKRPSCIHPAVCPNLNADHRPLLDIYKSVDALPGIKKSFIGSGVRYDLLLHDYKDETLKRAAREYTRELIVNHVSGRLKVAPEHTSDHVLEVMRKPSFSLFGEFKRVFEDICRREHINQQIIPYFISSHPGCTATDMAELAAITKDLDLQLEQVQDFTPTPMTVATEAWYTGYHPYTLQPIFSAHTPEDKQAQRMFFFWYKPEEQRKIIAELKRLNRPDLIRRLFGTPSPSYSPRSKEGKARDVIRSKEATRDVIRSKESKARDVTKPYDRNNSQRKHSPNKRKR